MRKQKIPLESSFYIYINCILKHIFYSYLYRLEHIAYEASMKMLEIVLNKTIKTRTTQTMPCVWFVTSGQVCTSSLLILCVSVYVKTNICTQCVCMHECVRVCAALYLLVEFRSHRKYLWSFINLNLL